jgi:hypothetical protein
MNVDLSIGGVRIRIDDPTREWRFAPLDPLAAFVVNGRAEPDIRLSIRRGDSLPAPKGEPVYATQGGLWNLHRGRSRLLPAPAEAPSTGSRGWTPLTAGESGSGRRESDASTPSASLSLDG